MITSEILAIINEIPLAESRTEAGLNLRQAMLVNGTLFDSEVVFLTLRPGMV